MGLVKELCVRDTEPRGRAAQMGLSIPQFLLPLVDESPWEGEFTSQINIQAQNEEVSLDTIKNVYLMFLQIQQPCFSQQSVPQVCFPSTN